MCYDPLFFCVVFSEKFKEDYGKLEALLQSLPNKTTHEVMVSFCRGQVGRRGGEEPWGWGGGGGRS